MKPLYEVGEEVILCSKSYPELNGDCFVTGAIFGMAYCSSRGETTQDATERWSYTLSIYSPDGTHWRESSLRKKYERGGQSFSEIMDKLTIKEEA